ncbi:hypothetical protein Fmac_004153 [Flemingia macrophylla]|uniref:Uncharacterized protein n=1 Tax=Flemingia macrophylla TaxID=520843 RepID=A0ABD1N438_9FABA
MAASDSRLAVAQEAINLIGLGFDLTQGIGFENCKKDSRLIFVNDEQCHNVETPGGVSVPNVPNTINCMKRHFNQQMHLGGDTAIGHLCASFGLTGRSVKHLASIKSDAIVMGPLALASKVYRAFGTHVVLGASMGGKHVLCLRQEDTSHHDPNNVQKLLEDTASMKFRDAAGNHSLASEDLWKEMVVLLHIFIHLLLSSSHHNIDI